MNLYQKKWLYLIVVSLIWGSSFILIKKSLLGITPTQLSALRVVITALILFPIGFKSLRTIEKKDYKWIAATGFLGTFFPTYLFSFAIVEMDSGVASILNSLVPLNTILIGLFVFKITSTKRQIVGVLIGFLGSVLLIASNAHLNPNQNYVLAGLIIIATVMYALSINIIKKYLQDVSALAITTGNFVAIIFPSLLVLVFADFFSETTFNQEGVCLAIFYIVLLSIFGTAIAKVIFNKLVQIASPVFASSVTYSVTVVAVLWGLFDGEKISAIQVLGGIIIMIGVYLANKRQKTDTN